MQVKVPDSEFQQLLFRTARINRILTDVKIYTKNPEKKLQAETLIRNNHDVFACEEDKLGETNAAEYDIDTGNAPPQAQQRYRTRYHLKK